MECGGAVSLQIYWGDVVLGCEDGQFLPLTTNCARTHANIEQFRGV
jgi:hypothetical protein